ncbi:MAG: hypothetical protein IJX30_02165 [Clostridia bacterium]|nr:hypothetical protein [Clostridia bacterium]
MISNQEKAQKYSTYIKRFQKAKEQKFYLEAMWILYAIIEDRTSAFLYHIGFTQEENRNKVTGRKAIKKDVREILDITTQRSYGFKGLSSKLKNIKTILEWAQNVEPTTPFQEYLKKRLSQINTEEFWLNINYLDNVWRDKRNMLTHTLFSCKEISEEQLVELLNTGFQSIRQFDQSVKVLKKVNIRKKFNIG